MTCCLWLRAYNMQSHAQKVLSVQVSNYIKWVTTSLTYTGCLSNNRKSVL